MQRALEFLISLAQTQHQAGLGQRLRCVLLGKFQDVQGLRVAGARITHRMGQALDRLQILCIRDQARIDQTEGIFLLRDADELLEHRRHRLETPGKVRGQRFHCCLG